MLELSKRRYGGLLCCIRLYSNVWMERCDIETVSSTHSRQDTELSNAVSVAVSLAGGMKAENHPLAESG